MSRKESKNKEEGRVLEELKQLKNKLWDFWEKNLDLYNSFVSKFKTNIVDAKYNSYKMYHLFIGSTPDEKTKKIDLSKKEDSILFKIKNILEEIKEEAKEEVQRQELEQIIKDVSEILDKYYQ